MNFVFVLTLVAYSSTYCDLSTAVRLRESSNVLVPTNDVNLHEKIKKLLSGDEVDREDFSDNEIERLSNLKISALEKLRVRSQKGSNKVFDDVNKNIEENQIDRDVSISSELDSIDEDSISLEEPTEKPMELPRNSSFSPTMTPIELASSQKQKDPTIPSILSTTFSSAIQTSLDYTTVQWSTQPDVNETTFGSSTFSGSTNSGSTSGKEDYTTPNNTTPSATTSSFGTTLDGTTENVTMSTDPVSSSDTTSTAFSTSGPTPTEYVTPESSSPLSESSSPSPESSTPLPVYDDLQDDECLAGKSESKRFWVFNDGSLNTLRITEEFGEVDILDMSQVFNSTIKYEEFVSSSINISVRNLRVIIFKNTPLSYQIATFLSVIPVWFG